MVQCSVGKSQTKARVNTTNNPAWTGKLQSKLFHKVLGLFSHIASPHLAALLGLPHQHSKVRGSEEHLCCGERKTSAELLASCACTNARCPTGCFCHREWGTRCIRRLLCKYNEIIEHRKRDLFLSGTWGAATAENPSFKDTDRNLLYDIQASSSSCPVQQRVLSLHG